MDQVLGSKPGQSETSLPSSSMFNPVSLKALDLMGDAELSQEMLKYGDNRPLERRQTVDTSGYMAIPIKALRTLGDTEVFVHSKVRRILGDSSDDGTAMAAASRYWDRKREQAVATSRKEVLDKRPDSTQRSVPKESPIVADKALSFFGDSQLDQQSREGVRGMVKPKSRQLLGEAKLGSKKAGSRLGSSKGDTKARSKANAAYVKMRAQET